MEEPKRYPEIETRFVATDETEKTRGIIRHEGRVTVILGSELANSSEGERQTSFKTVRKSFFKAVQYLKS